MKIVTKIIICLIISIIMFKSVSKADFSITQADLKNSGDCGELLMHNGSIIKTTYITYSNDGKSYPAYCLNRTKPGAETQEYSVSIDGLLSNSEVWRAIINGYPYKTLAELGVQTEYEAFTATKQAVYSKLEGKDISEYSAIPGNQASTRTYNAFVKIMQDSSSSNEAKQSAGIKINKESNSFVLDSKNTKCVSMIFNVQANATISKYNISLTGAIPDGIEITDINNNSKASFTTDEKFKILIPIDSMLKDGNFSINASGEVATKPIFYGKSPNSTYQDYAITASALEQGNGTTLSNYYKNLTKIVILKQDQDSKEALPQTEFALLDENKNFIKESLLTNVDGEIVLENMLPGIYYLKETKPASGYNAFPELIELEVGLNETLIVEIGNSLSDKVQVKKNLEVENVIKQTNTVKLPKTGM